MPEAVLADHIRKAASRLIQLCVTGRWRVVTAESLTGGKLAVALVEIPGASAVFTGGAVAYATELKASLLDVDEGLLATVGPVDGAVAVQLAQGARKRLGILDPERTFALSTTGVAGPDSQGGAEPGTVYLGVAYEGYEHSVLRHFSGDRLEIQSQAVLAALELGIQTIEEGHLTSRE